MFEQVDGGAGELGNWRCQRDVVSIFFWGIRFAFGPHVSHKLCVGCDRVEAVGSGRVPPHAASSRLLQIADHLAYFSAACGMQMLRLARHMPHAACNKAEFICAGHLVLVKLQLQLPRARQLHNLY